MSKKVDLFVKTLSAFRTIKLYEANGIVPVSARKAYSDLYFHLDKLGWVDEYCAWWVQMENMGL